MNLARAISKKLDSKHRIIPQLDEECEPDEDSRIVFMLITRSKNNLSTLKDIRRRYSDFQIDVFAYTENIVVRIKER